jgi:hypothetical protein
MKITKISSLTGIEHTMEIDCTNQQLSEYYNGWRKIQDIFPDLSADEREFIKTGITKNEWDFMYHKDGHD